MANFLTWAFEKLPEYSYKQRLREFLAFSKLVPKSVQDLSPLKGYELHHQLQPGDVVVDAGAYPGDYTLYAARKVGVTGYVIAFEPDKKNRAILERNIKAFKLKNVIVVPKGLWHENGMLAIASDGLHSTAGVPTKDYEQNTFTQIEVCRLDDELKKMGIKKVDKIKMDIEGAEIKALMGCVETLVSNDVHLAIATYHEWADLLNGLGPFKNIIPLALGAVPNTTAPIRVMLQRCGYQSKVDYLKHTTTYGWKDKTIKIKQLTDRYYPWVI
jgi:FkbM family methyltransferase